MQPATASPSQHELQKFLLGTLESDRAEEVVSWLDKDKTHSENLARIVANDTLTAAIGESSSAVAVPVNSIERIVKNVGHLLSESLPGLRSAETGSWVGSRETDEFKSPLPASLGNYRVLRKIGSGGMGIVVEAEDPRLHRRVAIKFMNPELAKKPQAEARFLKEARLAAAIEHENVVPIHEVNEDNGVPFIVMPLLRGESLKGRLERESPLPIRHILQIGQQIASGLAAAHSRGVFHRDIKPANIWLDDETGRARILDFGLARNGDELAGLTAPGTILGTPAYMAPEQIDGKAIDERCDLFSLGAILYECATGRQAFAGKTLTAILHAVANHRPIPPDKLNPTIPQSLSQLILQLLSKQAKDRPANATEVLQELVRTEATPVGSSLRVWGWVLAAFVLLGFVVAIGRFITRERTPIPDVVTLSSKTEPTEPIIPHASPSLAPLRVMAIEVSHFAYTPEGDVPQGVIGLKTFTPVLGDRVQITAKLSKPGYSYLIAFRPDSVAELCFPVDEDAKPTLTDIPRYPLSDGLKAYGLREGTGLWVFAVIASERPLPSFRTWMKEHTGISSVWKPLPKLPEGVVWRDDGDALVETYTASGLVQTLRSKGEELEGPAATIKHLTDSLRTTGQVDTVSAFGFGVTRRKN